MRKVLDFLVNLFEFPIILPIMLIYSLYVTKKIVDESDPTDLMSIEDENELWSHIEPHLDAFYEKHKALLYGLSTIFWILLILLIF